MQYRMHSLHRLPSQMFYNRKLKNGISVGDRTSPIHTAVRFFEPS